MYYLIKEPFENTQTIFTFHKTPFLHMPLTYETICMYVGITFEKGRKRSRDVIVQDEDIIDHIEWLY